ncbi:oligoendopeptidase F [Pseudarcicella hirudinis]|uniref:Oligoendopeptidase F n=1 Tax=Pseudarcicella hirudinis TaxID=1079859 RepID=A0A1I5XN53_9BACT|nr:M3 family oligoendopeptidase [Pseudarcicella hirudinis]SFQ33364.1 oligoendopeptidase F [Pseudarcicella hirudinis]
MTETINTSPKIREFLGADFVLTNWESVQHFYENLKDRQIDNADDLQKLFSDRSELESYLSENLAWRYIKMSCDNANEELVKSYQQFVVEIMPHTSVYEDALNKKVVESPYLGELKATGFDITIRGMKRAIEIFREENIPLFTEMQTLQTQYGAITGAMMVTVDGEEKTLSQAAALLENPDRSLREEIYRKIWSRRLENQTELDELLSKLIALRHQIAQNAGFQNYRDYMFAAMGRFDYTPQDCFDFHEAVAETIVPLMNETALERKKALGVSALRPWDKAVDPQNRPGLKPFTTGEDLLNKTIECFNNLDPFLADCLKVMRRMDRFDLESRKGKNPGGYNYPLEESGFPFIFMNAASQVRDMITLLHEGGHAVHSIVTKDLMLNTFRNVPSEVAELASMSMELITMDYWNVFFENEEDLKRAKIKHLEDIIDTLPWVATVDKFQHWLYENPTHSVEDRKTAWVEIYAKFSDSITDWSGLEDHKANIWQKQLHIFEVPFYYVEYGIAQLGAVGVWKNYKENPEKGLEGYLNALKLGYTKPMGEIYATANIPFDFSKEHIASLMNFVRAELAKLY